MGTLSEAQTKHADKLNTFKSNADLITQSVLFCGRGVELRKTAFGWTWSLHILYQDKGRFVTQDMFLAAEKNEDGSVDPAGYWNSVFRDKELEFPQHSLRLIKEGRRHSIDQFPGEQCPCKRMKQQNPDEPF